MKRILVILIAFCLMTALLPGCGGNTESGHSGLEQSTSSIATEDPPQDTAAASRLSVVTTIFPEYDWVREIAGDHVELTMLLDSGVDLHSYQPTVDDMVKISACDMFIYVGGESDEWVEDALAEAANPNTVVINLLEALGDAVKEEEVVEGMEGEEEEEEKAEEGEEEEEAEYDEHVWLSLKNAAVLCRYISDQLSLADPANAGAYESNTAAYLEKLSVLDAEYQAAVDTAAVKTVLFGDRFPFRYLVDDYGLDYYAAFVGCSAESEASFETIVFLANKVDELGLHSILQIESADGSIANTIKENTKTKDQTILTMDSLQSATSKDVQAGTNYLSVMQSNLDVLKEALK